MMCFGCCILLVGILYALAVNIANHFCATIMARYIWLEVVIGVTITIGVLWLVVGETFHVTQLLGAFALTGGPMLAGTLIRQGIADWLIRRREEEDV